MQEYKTAIVIANIYNGVVHKASDPNVCEVAYPQTTDIWQKFK